ncbi:MULTISPECIES: hypothetical protein [Methanosarcina]|uniref:Periplasmic binding protein n=2 Tax=Methanosarcina barkeri TaxID=2208 RepID=A0A0E3QUR2_METBA|nr:MULTISPECIES: hypothetical protein [Methanosarcina]AKB54488.1 Periplasmic binding protein [Methanosarcina barkeri MS]AKB57428.1 Periplasmic binding protein [Methanosarcina barkeri 227]
MKRTKELVAGIGILLIVSIFAVFSTANTQDTNTTDADTQIKIIDTLGREVTLDKPAEIIA